MKYSIEILKIIEGALKYDKTKVLSYTEQLIKKLNEDGEEKASSKLKKIINESDNTVLSVAELEKEFPIPIDQESRTMLADIVYPEENNVQVILSKKNREQLENFILNYQKADKLNEFGVGISNTLLLYGPPGCGKTQSAYFIAKKLNLPLVIARLDSLISSYLGTTSKNIRMLFEFIQKTPCVLFLDEFDAIAKARDDSNELGELKRVVNSLLQNVDTMSKDSLLLAATNHENLLDLAVWRRFDYKLEITLPDTEARIEMVDLFLGKVDKLTQNEKKEFAVACKDLSGSDIQEIIQKMIRNTIIHSNSFNVKDLYEELFIFKNINSNLNIDLKKSLKPKVKYLKQCDEKIFSIQIIAEILGISKSYVSKLLKEGEN